MISKGLGFIMGNLFENRLKQIKKYIITIYSVCQKLKETLSIDYLT